MLAGAGWITVTSARKDEESQDVTCKSILPDESFGGMAIGPRLISGTSCYTVR